VLAKATSIDDFMRYSIFASVNGWLSASGTATPFVFSCVIVNTAGWRLELRNFAHLRLGRVQIA
jgi:hypothetical protein